MADAAPPAPAGEATMEDFSPQRLTRTHRIVLDAPPERVFPLFTPLGERAWVPGWAPRFLWPADGEAVEGAVFLTRAAGELETIWTMIVFEPGRRVVYTRTTPGSRAGIVDVRCEADGDERTVAHVTYTYTALSARGNDYLAEWTEAEYRRSIDGWESAINIYLAGAPPPHQD